MRDAANGYRLWSVAPALRVNVAMLGFVAVAYCYKPNAADAAAFCKMSHKFIIDLT